MQEQRKRPGKFNKRTEERDEIYKDTVVEIKRVSKKTPGGGRMIFTALVVVGDRKGTLGVGLGKAATVKAAMDKGKKKAKKSLFTVFLKDKTIPHDIFVKRGAAKVFVKPAPEGAGIIAGGAARAVVELAGIENVSVKLLGTSNKASNVYATIVALKKLRQVKS